LKTKFNNVRKYNVVELKDEYLIDYDELINYFQNTYNIPKMYNVIDLDENKKLLTKKCPPGKELNPDTNRCRNKCEKTKIRNEKGNCVNKH
jgi:hypothetical protein